MRAAGENTGTSEFRALQLYSPESSAPAEEMLLVTCDGLEDKILPSLRKNTIGGGRPRAWQVNIRESPSSRVRLAG